jgi:predicted Zn-ribbon and HTH transcriptional regulator
MMSRCYYPKDKEYARYGGNGVTVCERWRTSLVDFYADMGNPPTPQHTLDRYPNQKGNYEPGNVRWATAKEQMNNLTTNRKLTVGGETLNLCQWVERTGLPRNTIYNRIERGWSDEDAVSIASRGRPSLRLKPSPLTKILPVDIPVIAELLSSGVSMREVAAQYGVQRNQIARRLRRLRIFPCVPDADMNACNQCGHRWWSRSVNKSRQCPKCWSREWML